MHAIFIYIIVRLDDSQQSPDLAADLSLVAAVRVIAQQLNCHTPPAAGNHATEWEDWIFEESRRRFVEAPVPIPLARS